MNEDKPTTTKPKHRFTLRRKLLIFIPATLLILGLALGLGLGLGLASSSDDSDSDSDSPDSSPTTPPLPSPTSKLPWTPPLNSTFQIILQNRIALAPSATSITPNVSIYDLDLFETSAETITTLHGLGKKVLCYFSGGSFEPGRPDSGEFEEKDLGEELDGWPGERWVRLGSEKVRATVKRRVELAAKKGCDGVDVDNVDGYQNSNGLSLTPKSSIDFLSYLSTLTTPLNLTLGLKNAGSIVPQVLPIVHFAVNEQCVEYSECSTFHAFIDAGKPVFHIEYPDTAGQKLRDDVRDKYCGTDGGKRGNEGFSTALKKMELDGWVEYCDGTVGVTEMG